MMKDKLATAIDDCICSFSAWTDAHDSPTEEEIKVKLHHLLYDLLSQVIDISVDRAMEQTAKNFRDAWNKQIGV